MTTPKTPDLAAVIGRCREVQFERESAREQKRNVEKFYRDVDVMALCRAVEGAQTDLAALRAELVVAKERRDDLADKLAERDAQYAALRERLAVASDVIAELAEDGGSSWESSSRCVGCGAYTGTEPHTSDCALVRFRATRTPGE